jgi:hypothetical protein
VEAAVVVCGREFSSGVVEQLQREIDQHPGWGRCAVARRACELLGWKAANGKWKEVSCRVALLQLHRRGVLRLPAAKGTIGARHRQPAPRPGAAAPQPIQGGLSSLGEVELVRVSGAKAEMSALWNELLDRYHYLGSGPLVGAQLRYLIRTERGYVGALAFSASAWHVAARDQWIGWSEAARRAHLPRVVCNSRFLILPWVQVKNLASKVLSVSAQRVAADWEPLYGYRPVLLESYVERGRFAGTSYQAANWQCVGRTQGRGRQDRQCRRALPRKDVYVYPLCRPWRAVLCGPPPPAAAGRAVHRRPPAQDWVEEEFGAAVLDDERLRKRLLVVARDFYARPQANVAQACGADRAKTKAAYRWLAHPEVKVDKIVAAHYAATAQRAAQEAVVLAVQDTTSFNYSSHPATTGLGPIGPGANGGPQGILMHDTMAYTVGGLPLGLVDVQLWVRDPHERGKKHRRHQLPIAAKESRKWLRSLEAAAAVQAQCPHTTVVSVGDREADIYELFVQAQRRADGPKLLVRADCNRLVAEGHEPLEAYMRKQPVCATQLLRVPRRGQRAPRMATLAVRFAAVELSPPSGKKHLGAVTLGAVLTEEIGAPAGVEAVQWMLLTTLEVASAEQALEKLAWYSKRWGIEVYHRTLKSGCRIEERQLATVPRIENCLAIDLVVAWRIVHLTMLGRETPTVPCTVCFEEHEWKALYAFIHRSPHAVPAHPPTMRDALRALASLGGFLGRNGDGEPGTKSLWLGLQRLDDIAVCWLAFGPESPLANLAPDTVPVSRKPRYG